MSKHTPGPWRVGQWSGRCDKPSHAGNHPGSDGPDPCVYEREFMEPSGDYVWGIAGPEGEMVVSTSYDELVISPPDARLIAAAPDMLALLQHIVANHGSVETPDTGLSIIGILASDFEAAKALIAKAEGREP